MYIDSEPAGKLIIQLAPTGMVLKKSDTPHVPLTPEEIADDTLKAYMLGASVVHIHAQDDHGEPTNKKEAYREIMWAVRKKCPDIIICASTSGLSDQDIAHRAEVLELKPDMATLMLGTVNFAARPSLNTQSDIIALAGVMDRHGVKPELEIFEPGFVNVAKYLARKGHLRSPLHFNLMLGSLDAAWA